MTSPHSTRPLATYVASSAVHLLPPMHCRHLVALMLHFRHHVTFVLHFRHYVTFVLHFRHSMTFVHLRQLEFVEIRRPAVAMLTSELRDIHSPRYYVTSA